MAAAVVATCYGGPSPDWDLAAYWDVRYPTCFAASGRGLRDMLEFAGYRILDADQLKTWMVAHIADGAPSVVVFCQDVVPDAVAESASVTCSLRRYLNAGGKIVWYADVPMYYQGHRDGSSTVWGTDGSISVLGFNTADGPWDSEQAVTFTATGIAWGLTQTWQSVRPTSPYLGLRALAKDSRGYPAAWVKHYMPGDTYRGFVRLFDRPGEPDFDDIRRVAQYPHLPEPLDLDNQAEKADDIVCTFHYPWYGNPTTSGQWVHWDMAPAYSPPVTWTANYLPNYPNSTWNPGVQLYDSSNTELLRWQDRAMARAGMDIAIASWWGMGLFEDRAFAKAIRICKSIQWCIYYELDAYGDPSSETIYNDLKYILDTYSPSGNYARVDGKWLVFVYGAGGEETANRWRQAKARLAANGYSVYLNADVSDPSAATCPSPWDAIHQYSSPVRQGLTQTLPSTDDSAWVSPGYWGLGEPPRLERSLSDFAAAWNNVVAQRSSCRFVLVETWNEWHEGTQIEPGQVIVPDLTGYSPGSYDYGYSFIDAIAPAAIDELHWTSSGHRAVVPTHIEAEDMIWDVPSLKQDSVGCVIGDNATRIGASILALQTNDLVFAVQAASTVAATRGAPAYPKVVLYLDDAVACKWEVRSATYQTYSTVSSLTKGIHKVEIGLEKRQADKWELAVDCIDIAHPVVE
ncbi:MAG: hypothetical protein A2Y77_13500 [Planctomycetes bacterium RBG_13_62_9]|nr:MAG: hypothetical protein A2Y77_13500 [Planctomycetes bacterium RBG_13_62_9]